MQNMNDVKYGTCEKLVIPKGFSPEESAFFGGYSNRFYHYKFKPARPSSAIAEAALPSIRTLVQSGFRLSAFGHPNHVRPIAWLPTEDRSSRQPTADSPYRELSINVTLLISFKVVKPIRTRSRADSRRNRMPSSRAARRISELGRLSRIISRIRSLSSKSS